MARRRRPRSPTYRTIVLACSDSSEPSTVPAPKALLSILCSLACFLPRCAETDTVPTIQHEFASVAFHERHQVHCIAMRNSTQHIERCCSLQTMEAEVESPRKGRREAGNFHRYPSETDQARDKYHWVRWSSLPPTALPRSIYRKAQAFPFGTSASNGHHGRQMVFMMNKQRGSR